MSLPPGPESHPVVLMWRWIRTPFELMNECHERFGDVFFLALPFTDKLGLVAISDPKAIKEIFGFGPDEAHAGESNIVLKPFLGDHSLLLLDGKEHLRHRKMILPAFHGERMLAYGKTMMDAAMSTIDRFPMRRKFAVHAPMQSLTLQIIIRTVFGIDEGPRFSELADVLARGLDASAWPGLLFPFMQHDFGPLSPWGRWVRLRNRATELLRAEISRARASKDPKRTDVLSMLLQTEMTDDEIHDELVTLLVAGHETTATSLAWALRWILPNRKLLGELREEILGVGDDPAKIAKLELLDDTVKETLRLQPVIPMVGRVLKEPRTIGGCDLRAGTVVAPSIYLVHQNPELYPNPTAFEPRRFRNFKPAAWEFLPFGGGLRKCVGAAFAIYEMKMVLATLLPRVEMRLASEDVKVARRSITLTPSKGLPVIVTSRISPAAARARRSVSDGADPLHDAPV